MTAEFVDLHWLSKRISYLAEVVPPDELPSLIAVIEDVEEG
jgi:hypothetical protein